MTRSNDTSGPGAGYSTGPRVLPPLDVLLVIGGNDSHDYDFIRPELIRLVCAGRDLRIDVRPDFSDADALRRTGRLLSYTCDVRPTSAQEGALSDFVESGGRWLALHSTNALFDVGPVRVVTAHERFFGIVGSKFLSHPPICGFGVRVAGSPVARQLMHGVPDFTTSDELYLLEEAAGVEVLLEVDGPADLGGDVAGTGVAGPGATLAYLHNLGSGQVLYCSLGHAGSPTHPHGTHRCSWVAPEFRLILDRATEWLLESAGGTGSAAAARAAKEASVA
jgi:type 1 glutamine amidotransferase